MKLFTHAFPIVARNLKSLYREKTFSLIVLLLVFIIVTMSILVSTVVYLFNPQFLVSEPLKVGVLSTTNVPDELLNVRRIDYTFFTSADLMNASFENGSLDAMLSIQSERVDVNDPLILSLITTDNTLTQTTLFSLFQRSLRELDSKYQLERGALEDAVWIHMIDFRYPPLEGVDILYLVIFTVMIPSLLVIPVFLVGNLFIDTILQEKEEGNLMIVFSAISPLRYVHEFLVQGYLISLVLVGAFLLLLKLRFFFVEGTWLVFLYMILFTGPILILSLWFSLAFEKKDIAQLMYTFSILSVFLFSPFLFFSPNVMISLLFHGLLDSYFGFFVLAFVNVVLYVGLRMYVKRLYY